MNFLDSASYSSYALKLLCAQEDQLQPAGYSGEGSMFLYILSQLAPFALSVPNLITWILLLDNIHLPW